MRKNYEVELSLLDIDLTKKIVNILENSFKNDSWFIKGHTFIKDLKKISNQLFDNRTKFIGKIKTQAFIDPINFIPLYLPHQGWIEFEKEKITLSANYLHLYRHINLAPTFIAGMEEVYKDFLAHNLFLNSSLISNIKDDLGFDGIMSITSLSQQNMISKAKDIEYNIYITNIGHCLYETSILKYNIKEDILTFLQKEDNFKNVIIGDFKYPNFLPKYLKTHNIEMNFGFKFNSSNEYTFTFSYITIVQYTLYTILLDILEDPKLLFKNKYLFLKNLLNIKEVQHKFIRKQIKEFLLTNLYNKILIYTKYLGEQFVSRAIEKNLMQTFLVNLEYKKTKKYIYFIMENIQTWVPQPLPNISASPTDNIIIKMDPKKIKSKNNPTYNTLLTRKIIGQNFLHSAHDMSSEYKPKYRELLQNTSSKFKINREFTYEFFINYSKFLNFLMEKKDAIINCGEFLNNTLFIQSIMFFSELLEFNFLPFLEQNYCNYITIFYWSIDLNLTNKSSLQDERINKNKMFKESIDFILGRKFFLNTLLNGLFIMSFFNYFHYNLFISGIGRVFIQQDGLSIYKPFVRNFISFYYNPKIKDVIKEKNLNLANSMPKIYKLLEEQIYSISPTFNFSVLHKNFTLIDLLELNKIIPIKFSELFTLYLFIKDYINIKFLKKDSFQNFYSLDASSSGIQMMGLLLKINNLGNWSNFFKLKNNKKRDIYSEAVNYTKGWFEKVDTFYKNLPPDSFNLLINTRNNMDSLSLFTYLKTFYIPEGLKDYLYLFNHIPLTKTYVKFTNELFQNPEIFQTKEEIKLYFQILRGSYLNDWIKKTDFLNFLVRAALKHAVMIDFYNGSPRGKQKAIFENIKPLYKNKGIMFDNINYYRLNKLTIITEKILSQYLKENYSEAFLLSKLIKKYLKQNIKINTLSFNHSYFSFIFHPKKSKRPYIKIPTGSLRKRMRHTVLQMSDEVYRLKLARAFVPHVAQCLDGLVMTVWRIIWYRLFGINLFSIHDRYFSDPAFCLFLKKSLVLAYKNVCKMKLLETGFKKEHPKLLKLIKKELKKHTLFKFSQINSQYIVKH